MSLSQKTLDMISKKIKNNFNGSYKLSSLDRVLNKGEEKKSVPVRPNTTPVKLIVEPAPLPIQPVVAPVDNSTATQLI